MEVVVAEAARAVLVHHRDRAHQLAGEEERRHHHAVELDSLVLRRASRPLLVARDDQRLARRRHVTHGPFAELHASAGRVPLTHVVTRHDLQLTGAGIEYRQLAVADAEQRDSPLQNRLQQARQLELGQEIRHGRAQRFLLIGTLPLGREQPGAPDRDARLLSRRRENLEILGAKRVRLVALHDQHADQLAVHLDRNIDFRPLIPRR